jgi:hypothetical protein
MLWDLAFRSFPYSPTERRITCHSGSKIHWGQEKGKEEKFTTSIGRPPSAAAGRLELCEGSNVGSSSDASRVATGDPEGEGFSNSF